MITNCAHVPPITIKINNVNEVSGMIMQKDSCIVTLEITLRTSIEFIEKFDNKILTIEDLNSMVENRF